MKSAYAIISNLTNSVYHMAREGKSQRAIGEYYTTQIQPEINRQYANGRYVYTVHERAMVVGAYHATTETIKNCFTEFGYWYGGNFYSTHCRTKHNTTKQLQDIISGNDWNELRHGIYYSDSFNTYFE